MKILTASALALGAAVLALPAASVPAAAQEGVKVGVLTCEVTEVTNVIVYTDQEFDCVYDPADSDRTEAYRGQIDKIGIDLSIKDDFTIVWAVFAPTEKALEPDVLAGTYAGASADVAAGVGAGAKVLVGGGNSISLQPVSVTGVEGVGVSVGIESFELEAK